MFVALEESFEAKPPWRKQRPKAESVHLKWTNITVWVVCLICFMLTAFRVQSAATKSVDGFWDPGTFTLKTALLESLNIRPGCSVETSLKLRGWEPRVILTALNRDYLMAHAAGLIRRAVWFTGAALFLGFLNKLLFVLNIHEISRRRWVVPKGYLILLELFFIVWSIGECDLAVEPAAAVTDYLDRCAPGRQHVWEVPPFIAIYVAHGLTLAVYVINWVFYYTRTRPYSVYSGGQKRKVRAWPVLRRHWRALGAMLTAPAPDLAVGVEAAMERITDGVVGQLRTLKDELSEIAREYRSQDSNAPL
eukprot:TRINITY_DN10393_c0_g1_i1.p1 TRINITY_DN10393_c0_g1~~TRINITY_DN10393_c0_g1_i1.p1  ORF type:complete len:334 (+),score=94.07 TRINITY_DN10393_c0_g1_i1:87-1004(+)